MIRLFLDTNAILDLFISERAGHRSALALEQYASTHPCRLAYAWHSLSIIEYIGRKKFGAEATHFLIKNLLNSFQVPSTGTEEAKRAFHFLDGDFEDALQISAAVTGGADYILTNDAGGFGKSPVPVLSVEGFLSTRNGGNSL